MIRKADRHALGQRTVFPRLAHALEEQRFRPRLHVAGLEILRDVEAVHRTCAAPDTREIGLAIRRARRGRRQVGFAIWQTWYSGLRIVEPLRGGSNGYEQRDRDDDHPSHMRLLR